MQALRLDKTELSHVPTQCVDQHGPLADSRSRARCMSSADCCSIVFTGTKRIDGRLTASQIAAASAASFLLRLT